MQRNRMPTLLKLITRLQHWPEEETQRVGPPHSPRVIMAIPAIPITATRPRGASSRGRREPVAVAASRTRQPEHFNAVKTESTTLKSQVGQHSVSGSEKKYLIE